MLPQNNNNYRTIYINPNFKGHEAIAPPNQIPANAHINPLFLAKQTMTTTTIHMNPRFLLKMQEQQQNPLIDRHVEPATAKKYATSPDYVSSPPNAMPTDQRKIICKSKNCLIREPVLKSPQKPLLLKSSTVMPTQPLVVVTKRKLIRKSVIPLHSKVENVLKGTTGAVGANAIKTKYKLDNRVVKKRGIVSSTISKIKRKSFVGRYALRRTSTSLTPPSPLKYGTARKSTTTQSMNRKLQLLNINGLLYKSTRNSLQLKDISNKASNNALSKTTKSTSNSQATKPLQGGLTIFVRGTKYIMDPQKFKLTRVTNTEKDITTSKSPNKSATCRRIDIGGFTYVSVPSAKNVLIRTSNHLSRAYVNNAKQKSLQVLSKHLVKSNIPCPIYQRVGKCAAFERGKCSKVHNKQQVAICSKFLRGECLNLKCLLSHDVSLSKMPVCKFFLQGVCVRNDCPYLHKKLSNNAEVCIEFLRGFCQLADKCNKRHEFVCPELERTGSCASKNCLFCKSKLKRQKHLEKQTEKVRNKDQPMEANDEPSLTAAPSPNAAKESHEKSIGMRYFIGASLEAKLDTSTTNNEEAAMEAVDDGDDESKESTATKEESVRKRPKLGILPAFIPL